MFFLHFASIQPYNKVKCNKNNIHNATQEEMKTNVISVKMIYKNKPCRKTHVMNSIRCASK